MEDSIFSPTVVAGCVNGMRKRGPLKAGVPGHPKHIDGSYTVIGLDPAMAGATGAVVVTYNRSDGKIYVLDCVNMTDTTLLNLTTRFATKQNKETLSSFVASQFSMNA